MVAYSPKPATCATLTKNRIAASQGGPYAESIWVFDIETCVQINHFLNKEIKATKPLWGCYGGKPLFFIDDNTLLVGGACVAICDVRSGDEVAIIRAPQKNGEYKTLYNVAVEEKKMVGAVGGNEICVWDLRRTEVGCFS